MEKPEWYTTVELLKKPITRDLENVTAKCPTEMVSDLKRVASEKRINLSDLVREYLANGLIVDMEKLNLNSTDNETNF